MWNENMLIEIELQTIYMLWKKKSTPSLSEAYTNVLKINK